jgi:hypothetical protein
MMLQVGVSLYESSIMLQEPSFMLLENSDSSGVTHDYRNM